jgi:4-amino-4-deoxy-L-arabinose transferase-like glycosyltransferase
MQSIRHYKILERFFWLLITSALVTGRLAFPPRDFEAVGFGAAADISLTLLLWLVIVYTQYALGGAILTSISSQKVPTRLISALALPVGFGISGTLIGILGMAGLLSPPSVFVYLGVSIFMLAPELTTIFENSLHRIRSLPNSESGAGFIKYAKISAVLIAGFSFINSLVPPWSYDALMYHLPGPEQFLEAGRIFPFPDNWYVNGPFAIEMAFTFGLAMQDAIIPKLIHWSFSIALIALTHAFAEVWFDNEIAWYSTIILLTIPIIPIISGFAYIDLAWATFEFAAFACLIQWNRTEGSSWLTISGILLGLAVGSKYLGLMGLAAAGIFFLTSQFRKRFNRFPTDLARISIPVLILGLPWYLKNLIVFVNPVYPLYFGGPEWDQTRLSLYMQYLGQFGTGRTIKDFILLPWNIYARHEEFGAVFNRNDIPSLLFPLSAAVLFLPKDKKINNLILFTILRFGFWLIGSHQIRFLLPVYPLLAILTAYSISQITLRAKRIKTLGFFFQALTIGLTAITIFYQIQIMRTFNTLSTAAGLQSKDAFLSRASRDYPAKSSLMRSDSLEGKLLLLGNGRNYYCQDICIPDPDHFHWSSKLAELTSPESVTNWLSSKKISYVLLSNEDIGFLLNHDPDNVISQAIDRINEYQEAGCLELIFNDENNRLFRSVCRKDK